MFGDLNWLLRESIDENQALRSELSAVRLQSEKDLLSERLLRIDFQMQLLGLLRSETQQQLRDLLDRNGNG